MPIIKPTASRAVSFTDNGKVDPEGFFTISGNTSATKGSVTYDGKQLTTCLKIETSTNISFTAEAGKLILIFGGTTSAVGKQIKVDGKSYDIPASQICEIELLSGRHAITKDDSINLFYMAFVPNETHTHEYEQTVTEPGCTEGGLVEYLCSCGDSYTEQLDPTGHDFEEGVCVNCGADDPDYIPEEDPGDDPITDPDTPDNPGGTTDPDDPTDDPKEPEDPEENEPETPSDTPDGEEDNRNIFQIIWDAIVDFFKWLFGIED